MGRCASPRASAGGLRVPRAEGLRIWKVHLGVGVTRTKIQIEGISGTSDQGLMLMLTRGVMPSADDSKKAQRAMPRLFKRAARTQVPKDRGLSRGNFLGH